MGRGPLSPNDFPTQRVTCELIEKLVRTESLLISSLGRITASGQCSIFHQTILENASVDWMH